MTHLHYGCTEMTQTLSNVTKVCLDIGTQHAGIGISYGSMAFVSFIVLFVLAIIARTKGLDREDEKL